MKTAKQQINKTAIYCRLSVEDKNVGESGSIETQKTLLKQYCKEKQFNIAGCYVDDGVSGTSFERPGFEQMLADIDAGKINTVVTKDLSRFGRDYIQAGYYIEKVFKQKDVRFIAVNDNIDTANGIDDILMPIKNVINDMYCREASRKTKAAHRARAKEGKYLGGHAPFGYIKNPSDKHHLMVDPPAAAIVRNIFELASHGIGYGSIAKALRAEKTPNPQAYFNQNNPDFYKKSDYWRQPFDWHVTSIMSILKNPVYTGAVVFGRTKTKIISTNHRSKVPEDEWILVEGTHEPIVSRETWDVVQKLLASKRRETKDGEIQMFAGLVKCAGCGSSLNLTSKNTENGKKHQGFSCWVYKNYGKERCTSHAIGYKTLYTLVYENIRRNALFAAKYEKKYMQLLIQASGEKQKKELEKYKREIRTIGRRLTELDKITSKLYEDSALGRISDERYSTLSAKYDTEQFEIKNRLAELYEQINAAEQTVINTEKFISFIRRYTEIEELDAKILNELIDRIVVHEKEVDEDGRKFQRVDIYYKFIGFMQINLDMVG